MTKVVFSERRWVLYSLRMVAAVALIGFWQLLVSGVGISTFALATPMQVATQLVDWFRDGTIWPHLASTMIIFLGGFAIGLVSGIIIGSLMGIVPVIRYYFQPFVGFFNSVPRLVLIPFFLVIFGFDYWPGIYVTALVIAFLIIITVQAGIEEIQGDFVLNAQMLGAGWLSLVTSVYLPGVAVRLLSTARLAVGLAFQAAVVTEFFGSTRGLGYLLVEGETEFRASETYGAIVLTALLAYVIDTILRFVQKRYVRWEPSA